MTYRNRRKLAYILMALSSSHIWYYFLADRLCDTAFASFGFSLAQILAVALPFICCLVWNKEKTYNRINFVIVYFFVQSICDYLHSFIYNMVWDIDNCFDIFPDMSTVQYLVVGFMVIVRIILSVIFLRLSYKNILIVSKFRDK